MHTTPRHAAPSPQAGQLGELEAALAEVSGPAAEAAAMAAQLAEMRALVDSQVQMEADMDSLEEDVARVRRPTDAGGGGGQGPTWGTGAAGAAEGQAWKDSGEGPPAARFTCEWVLVACPLASACGGEGAWIQRAARPALDLVFPL